MEKKLLGDIFPEDDRNNLNRAWDETAAAEEFAPLPAGEYVARIAAGELIVSSKGTPGFKLTFQILEGEHARRFFWHDIWLTPAALPMAKRDLAKFGITTPEQLEYAFPPGFRCKVSLALRREDDGTERNRVRGFSVLGVDSPESDPFAPADSEPGSPTVPDDTAERGAS